MFHVKHRSLLSFEAPPLQDDPGLGQTPEHLGLVGHDRHASAAGDLLLDDPDQPAHLRKITQTL